MKARQWRIQPLFNHSTRCMTYTTRCNGNDIQEAFQCQTAYSIKGIQMCRKADIYAFSNCDMYVYKHIYICMHIRHSCLVIRRCLFSSAPQLPVRMLAELSYAFKTKSCLLSILVIYFMLNDAKCLFGREGEAK